MPLDLRAVPTGDLMFEIIARCIERDNAAAAVTGGLIKLLEQTSVGLSEQRRFETAEKLRDLGDRLERSRAIARVG